MYQSGKIISDEEKKRTYPLFPKKVLENVREVSAGTHSMAIKNDGSLWAWGYNLNGVFGNGRSSDFVNFDNNSNVPIKVMDDVATVSCGPSHVLAVKTDGSLWAWGANDGTIRR
jgi:alpha-tubulin suppressor-like RCC1 family protein